MQMEIKTALNRALKKAALAAGFEVSRAPKTRLGHYPAEIVRIRQAISLLHSTDNGSDWSRRFLSCAVKYFSYSHSQIMQDLFVLSVLGEKRNGYFVEVGVGNGTTNSNSFMLESKFGWTGILAEPCRTFATSLAESRRCAIDNRCVWSSSGEKLKFAEVLDARELSTIVQFVRADPHDRKNHIEYNVETVSLNDLVDQHHAPAEIEYLSIDTEGSELEILKTFKFNQWRFNVITLEHNYVAASRDAIFKLLTANGYARISTELALWDDWYVRSPGY